MKKKRKKDLSDEKLFELDSSIFKITQEKKDVLTAKHQKKLAELIQRQTGENTKDGETFKTVQKKKDKKVSTRQTFSSNSETKQAKAETNRQSKPRRKRKSKHKSKIAGQCAAKETNNSFANDKSKKTSNSDDVIIVGETKPNKNQETSQTPVQEQTKNAFAPGKIDLFGGHKTRGEDSHTGVDREISPRNTPDSCSNNARTNQKHSRPKTTRRFTRCKKQKCVEEDQEKSKPDRKRQKDGFKFI